MASEQQEKFTPSHITVTEEDCAGNGPLGRFWVVPGSMARSKDIADTYLTDVSVRESSRGHNAYLGILHPDMLLEGLKEFSLAKDPACRLPIEVGVMSTGMGTPSVDIVITELIKMGATLIVRVGTAGAVDPSLNVGDLVVASSAVRDEGTTRHYMPLEFPATAHPSVVSALNHSAVLEQLWCEDRKEDTNWVSQSGIVHTKDTLMAREFKFGPLHEKHEKYMETLEALGCLASEMECSGLFTLGQVYRVKTGAILGIIGGKHCPIVSDGNVKKDVDTRSCRVAMRSFVIFRRLLAKRNTMRRSQLRACSFHDV